MLFLAVKNTLDSFPTPAMDRAALDAVAAVAAAQCPVGIVLARDRRIVWCNERFAADFGYTVDDLIGESLATLYPSVTEFTHVGERNGATLVQDGLCSNEQLMRVRDGGLQWFRVIGRATDRAAPQREAVWLVFPLATSTETARLTPREREVLMLLAEGQTAKECARDLNISPRTVEKVIARLRMRVRARNVAELMSRVASVSS
ncbi:LuxR family transcriptional regulator [Burkholderia anthina]|uniref:LuxR family transcriptional regulator n=1 Tax=Burkholderia anthina TaxID=179879 RepID=UPI00158F4A13|nr:LuxR C-terminal-related transcriptional regulator [Burkholderia anthina]